MAMTVGRVSPLDRTSSARVRAPRSRSSRVIFTTLPSRMSDVESWSGFTGDVATASTLQRVSEIRTASPVLCVPRMSSTALTSRVALPAVRP